MNLERQSFDIDEPQAGPSWAPKNWPQIDSDDLTAALDPQQMQVAVKAAAAKGGAPLSNAEVERAANDSIRAMMLIRTYRVRGHLAANLDPLGLSQRELPADLTPEYHGFVGADQDRPVWLGGTLGFERATVRELVAGGGGGFDARRTRAQVSASVHILCSTAGIKPAYVSALARVAHKERDTVADHVLIDQVQHGVVEHQRAQQRLLGLQIVRHRTDTAGVQRRRREGHGGEGVHRLTL